MRQVGPFVFAAAAAALAGCGSGAADKAGGSPTPAVLTVAVSDNSDQPDAYPIEQFAKEVARRSRGSLRIHVIYQAAGAETPYVEERVIRAVEAGRFDLGFVGARAWDEVGVKSFRALQAPFLITGTHLLDRVVTSPLADEMLAALASRRLVGLALVPDDLRHPIGLTRELTSPADFAGARIRIQPSRVTAALMRALGAVPLEISNQQVGAEIGAKRVDGEELSMGNAFSPSIVTGNVVFFPKALTLFARGESFDRLTDGQRSILRAAAAEAVHRVVAYYPTDAILAKHTCASGSRLALATKAERRALLRLAQPVYRMLESDPKTRDFIDRIRAWKRTTRSDPPVTRYARCKRSRAPARATGPTRPPSQLDGTYRWVLTRADARKGGPGSPNPGDTFPMISTAVLRGGTWAFSGPDHDHGTFSIRGDRIRFVWPRIPSILVFRYTRDADGTIHLTPVRPMDPGDQFVWAYKPWKRIGPPVRLQR
jgi:TRAP-type C4-dicarboxylate transport system substrate-binding protein